MKLETIKSVTKGDINDLKAYANAIGVKCENCDLWRSENNKHGQCPKMTSHNQVITTYDFFCSNFIKKLIPKTKD